MKFYLTLQDLDVIDDSYRLNFSEYFDRTGRNVGNLVFRSGLSSMVDNISDYHRITLKDLNKNPDIYAKATQVIVSCANWLGDSEMHDRVNLTRYKIFEKFNCPIVPFGIGIQSALDSRRVEFGKNTLEFAKLLSEKSPFISVRCNLTKDTLAMHGIKNAVVTGCPSNFINLDLSSESFCRINRAKLNSRRISCLISEATSGNKLTLDFINRAFTVLANTPSKYALQVGPLIELVLGFKNKVPDTYLKNNVVESETRIVDFIKDKALVFSSVPEWLFFARRFDLCFGMRMHGSMVALQAGVPTVIVYHDLRTRELAERMKIPKISIADFCALKQSEIFEHMHTLFFDQVDAYFSRRQELASVFSDFMSAANIEMSTDFKKFVNA